VSTLIGLIVLAYAYYVIEVVVGLVLLGVGIPLVVVGAILLAKAVRERNDITGRMSALRYRIRNLEANGGGVESPLPVAPDAPPPPPGAMVGPESTMLVAVF
jgi:hypothetical protein